MKFVNRLITERHQERQVQKFAPDRINAEGAAHEMLKAGCVPGDKIEIYEFKPVLVKTLTLNQDGSIGSHPASNPGNQTKGEVASQFIG